VLCQVDAFKILQGRNALPEADSKLYEFVVLTSGQHNTKVMPDDHSELVPLLPIPNRTVKRLSADDSAGSRVKVGHRQALTALRSPSRNAGPFVSGVRWGGSWLPINHRAGRSPWC
jgi:hypothetical protein